MTEEVAPAVDEAPAPAAEVAPAEVAPAAAAPTSLDPVAPADNPWYTSVPDEWRKDLVGDDEAALNTLQRVPDIKTLGKNYIEAQAALRAKQDLNTALPENPTDEQLSEYREKNNVPATAEGYLDGLSEGLVLNDEDKAELGPLFETLHNANVDSGTAAALVEQQLAIENARVEKVQQQDVLDAQQSTELMKKNWGPDFEVNKNLIKATLQAHLPEAVMDDFLSARLANGKAVFNDPGVMQAFASMARVINPAATLVPTGVNAVQTLAGRQKEIESKMGTDEYYSSGLDKEYLANQTALDTLNSRQGS